MSKFVHLHTHTEFSTLDGINRVHSLPEYVRDELDQAACAITDHGTLSGAYKFYKACNSAGIKPIIGLEAYYTVMDRSARERDIDGERYYHLVLLAKNHIGLKNLIKVSSRAYTEGMFYKPRLDDEVLADCAEGLIATTACLGSRTSKLILTDRMDEAERLIDHHAAMFKDNFFVELQLHEDEPQQKINRALIEMAGRKNLPLLLTNDSHYTHQHDKILHEQALCMQTNDVMYNPKRFSFGDIDVHLAHHDWMAKMAERQGIPYSAISNTVALANQVRSDQYFSDIKNRYPKFPRLKHGKTAHYELEYLAKTLLMKKFGGQVPPREYIDRVNHELKVIKRMGFSDYMLIVHEFIDAARTELDVWVGPGRGSAAGSLVAYALGISQVDPIKYGLLFSRFLNAGRGATPMLLDRDMINTLKAAEDTNEESFSETCGICH